MRTRAVIAMAAALVGCGCQIPQDPDGTLDRVEDGTMRVGIAEADPWVKVEDELPTGGAEVRLVRRFARDLDARVEWVSGSEEELVNALKEGALDLVIAGMTKKSRWKKDVALTRPYATTKIVVGAPRFGPVIEDLDGETVSAESGSEAAGLVDKKTEADLRTVRSLEGVRGAAAVEDYLLDDLDLHATEFELKKDDHVMAVKLGENAFLVRLERFLLGREDEIRRLVAAEGRP